jgi:hypothetical protein
MQLLLQVIVFFGGVFVCLFFLFLFFQMSAYLMSKLALAIILLQKLDVFDINISPSSKNGDSGAVVVNLNMHVDLPPDFD